MIINSEQGKGTTLPESFTALDGRYYEVFPMTSKAFVWPTKADKGDRTKRVSVSIEEAAQEWAKTSTKLLPPVVAPKSKITLESVAADSYVSPFNVLASAGDKESLIQPEVEPGSLLPFSAEVFTNLPALLRQPCQLLTSDVEREVFLIGALGVVSGILPNVQGFYDGDTVAPNLYVYVLAPYGTGKGALKYAQRLGALIHRKLREQTEQAQTEYDEQKAQFEKNLATFKRDKKGTAEPPAPPAPPKNRMLYIPANNSKTGFFQLLDENEGRAVLFETEGDTLADAIGQDYGNFSDGLRKAFHHETISYYRRGNGGEFVEIQRPALSLILSSTFDQLLNLLPTAENGLFSRFLYYNLQPDTSFRDVFDPSKRAYESTFEKLATEFGKMFDYLTNLGTPLQIELTANQRAQFLTLFSDMKRDVYDDHSPDLGGSVNRLGLICFRVCMVFTALRAFETGNTAAPMICSDTDFDNAVRVVRVLLKHALSVYWRLPQSGDATGSNEADMMEVEQKRRCRELKKEGLSVRKIAVEVFGTESKKNTVNRWTA